ncbi:SRPBCC domain-containing protein [Arthrobacter sp. ZGTC212]|uniref:SRPBCC domain-containing protein n=1 Tax=Arthrobacter sp. ZGTC212 TaxID=2058899 RepID=UPI000CE48DB5|nr:SRPBCC domain-containing protein [Arthrobacter sp. ZGTC212]
MPLTSRSIDAVAGRVSVCWSLPAASDRVWWGLTSPEALPHWIGTVTTGEMTVGAVVTIRHAEDYSCTSEILGCGPEAWLALTWKFPDEPLSQLCIEVAPEGSATQLDLIHEGLEDEAPGYLSGWQTHLFYLEHLLQGRPLPMEEFWQVHERLDRKCRSKRL